MPSFRKLSKHLLLLSVTKLHPTLCNPMDCRTPGSLSFTISWSSLKVMFFESEMLSNHLILCTPFSFCPQSFPASESFPMSQLFTSGGQSVGVSQHCPPPLLKTQQREGTQAFGWINKCRTISLSYVRRQKCLLFSHSVRSDSLWPHGLQPTRLLCP